MTKVAMPEPTGFIRPLSLSFINDLSDRGLIYTDIRRRGDDEFTAPIYTTDQAEAYANARVREALEEAARACESRIRTGDPGVDTTEVDIEAVSCAAAIRALLPSTPARPESEQ